MNRTEIDVFFHAYTRNCRNTDDYESATTNLFNTKNEKKAFINFLVIFRLCVLFLSTDTGRK